MTLAELERLFDSKRRQQKREQQDKAYYDYRLADLIGRSVGRIYSSATKMPEIYEAYPGLFDEVEIQEKREQQQIELSALRFRLFTDAHNKRYKQEV